jgi:hypothetical protein
MKDCGRSGLDSEGSECSRERPMRERREETTMSEETTEQSELERLRVENARLKSQGARAGSLTVKVSEKGAVSVYGLGRFPVTLYQEQWDKLLGQIDELRAFIESNRASLKKKDAAG